MVRIVADTTSSIPVKEAEQLGIDYLPQIIIFGEESFRDDTEMDNKMFLKKLRASSTLPKTAAPPPQLYNPIFEKVKKQDDTAIVICPTGEMSGTLRSALTAANDFPDADIRVIDTRTIAAGLGSIVRQAVKWANQGLDADTIVANVKEMASREKVYFLVDTLEYLYKGGRIGGAQALFGSLLQVKPILTLKDGHTEPVESQRTKHRAIARLQELVVQGAKGNKEPFVTIMEGDALEDAKEIAKFFETTLGINEVPMICDLPPAILTHAGPGVLAVSFFYAEKPA